MALVRNKTNQKTHVCRQDMHESVNDNKHLILDVLSTINSETLVAGYADHANPFKNYI